MKEEFPKPNLNPGENLEKMETTKNNLYVVGALSNFRGFGDFIASYYDKNNLSREQQKMLLDLIGSWDNKIADNPELRQVSSGFIEQKNDSIFFAENYPAYTKFPEQNRFYRQTVYSWINSNNPDSANAGKIFSCMKPFKQYPEQSFEQEKIEVVYNKKELLISEKLKDLLRQVLESPETDKKLFIEDYVDEGSQLLGEDVLETPSVKTLLNTFDTLPPEQHKNFSLFFGDVDQWSMAFNNKKIAILLKQIKRASFKEYYKEKGSIFVDWKDIAK